MGGNIKLKVINFPFKGISKIPGSELGFKFFLKEILLDKNRYFAGLDFKDFSKDLSGIMLKEYLLNVNEDVLIFGGDHSTTSKIINEVLVSCPSKIMIFDAHNDFENIFEEKYKNWNVLNYICNNELECMILGYRYKCEEMNHVKTFQYIEDTEFLFFDNVLKHIKKFCKSTDHIYVSIDLDVLSIFEYPGVGFKCAGGISLRELILCIKEIFQHCRTVIIDIVEFNPLIEKEYSIEALKRLFLEIKNQMCIHNERKPNGNIYK